MAHVHHDDQGTSVGLILGIILAIVVIALVWFAFTGNVFGLGPARTEPAPSGPTININPPPSGPNNTNPDQPSNPSNPPAQQQPGGAQ
jgi:hypothetical protein